MSWFGRFDTRVRDPAEALLMLQYVAFIAKGTEAKINIRMQP